MRWISGSRRAAAAVMAMLLVPGGVAGFGQTPAPPQGGAIAARAPQSDELTIAAAVERALREHPAVRATEAGRRMAAAQQAEARAGRLPVMQFREAFTRSNNPVFVFGSLLEQARFGPQNFSVQSLNSPPSLNNFRSSLEIRAPLFDQGRTAARQRESAVRLEQADAHSEEARQGIRFQVLSAYYGVLLAEARLGVADDAVRTAEADVKLSRDRVDVGTAVASDLLAAEVQLAEFRQERITAEGDLAAVRAALNLTIGLPLEVSPRLTAALAERTFVADAEGELVRTALANRPDFLRADLEVRAREAAVRGARGEWLPRVDVFTGYGLSGRNLASGSGDYAVGASLTFTIFDAGRSSRISAAEASAAIAEGERDKAANDVRLDVIRAHQNFLSARGRLDFAARSVEQATEAWRIVQDRYREGLSTITEVLRAETAVVRARLGALHARYDHSIGYARLLLVTGRLTDVSDFL
ncbi:MAG: TolC family protein [Blastocatellales bacterium]|nr:TolC family protein [Blastocatellales bacterium]